MRWNLMAAFAAVLWVVGLVVWQWSLWIAVPVLAGALAATGWVNRLRWQQRDHGGPTTSLAQRWVLDAREWAGSPVEKGEADRTAAGTAERLQELEGLRRDGLVTEAEYEAKRSEIIDGL